jgi:hypothetical protein
MNLSSLLARIVCTVTLGSIMAVAALCQASSSHQTGTIMEVKAHQAASDTDATVKRYDVSVKVGNTVYVVLFTPPKGSNLVEYKAGTDLPVRVEGNTMKISDLTGHSETVPILSRKEVNGKKSK